MRLARGLSWLESHLTIRARLTLWYAVLLGLSLVAFGGVLYWSLSIWLYAQNTSLLATHAAQVAAGVSVGADGRLFLPEPEDLATSGTLVAIYDSTGTRILGPQLDPVFPTRLTSTDETSGQTKRYDLANGDAETLTVAVSRDGEPIAWVIVMRSLRTADDALFRLLTLLALFIPLAILVATAGGFLLARRALSPISGITRTARAISYTNLSERIGGPSTPDEVGHLAATFDEMLDRLDQAFQRERRFTADASHELRTPLAVISAQAEEGLRRPEDPETARRSFASILEHAKRMGRLTNQLLALARADAGQARLGEVEPLSLADLVADIADEMRQLAGRKGVNLNLRVRDRAVVLGDQTGLTGLFINIIGNALRYTPAGGTVTVSLTRRDDQAEVGVSDTGPGIPPQDLPHVFERFYRVDKARSRQQGGTGLGLAIAKAVALAHGGDIEVASRLGEGTTFTITLPCLRSQTPPA